MRESNLVNEIIRAAYPVMRLWRVNVGRVKTADGRIFSTGLPRGFSDLFGILPAENSANGQAVPVFIEVKVRPNKPSPEQIRFVEEQRKNGAVAGVVYSIDDVWELLLPHLKTTKTGA